MMWLLICKYIEPFWQEVSVESLILRWLFGLWTSCFYMIGNKCVLWIMLIWILQLFYCVCLFVVGCSTDLWLVWFHPLGYPDEGWWTDIRSWPTEKLQEISCVWHGHGFDGQWPVPLPPVYTGWSLLASCKGTSPISNYWGASTMELS